MHRFFYGSHFSAPALVLFYLVCIDGARQIVGDARILSIYFHQFFVNQVRKFPKLMLCLQNGHFDHPDRMFNRVSDAFNNCLNNMADFKVKRNWQRNGTAITPNNPIDSIFRSSFPNFTTSNKAATSW